jgi:hypothetical protein
LKSGSAAIQELRGKEAPSAVASRITPQVSVGQFHVAGDFLSLKQLKSVAGSDPYMS